MTIFSAPNYCGEFNNAGAFMSVDDTLMCSFQILMPVRATFNEPTGNFTVDDIQVTGPANITSFAAGTVQSVFGSAIGPTVYEFNVVPTEDGDISVQVPVAAANDAANNPVLASNTVSFKADQTLPTLNLSSASSEAVRQQVPADDRPETIEAARIGSTSVYADHHFNNPWWMDPVCLGRYPEQGLELFGAAAEGLANDADLAEINQPIDFLGLNTYQGATVKAGPDGQPVEVERKAGHPVTHFDWPVTPEALRWTSFFVHERYDVPIYITENGLASMDWVARDGRVHDANRIDFTARYLEQLGLAIGDGADVRGYFHWSILDNFEWGEGYNRRFGMVHVDYETLERTVKDSARWYSGVIACNGESLD